MLAKKFFLCFLVPVALLLAGSGVALYDLAATRLQDQVDRNLLGTVRTLEIQVTDRLDTAKSDLRVLAAHPAFGEYFQFSHFDQFEQADARLIDLGEYFVAVAELKPCYSKIALHDTSGEGLAMVDKGERSYVAANTSADPWFRAAIALDHDEASVSRVHTASDGRKVVTICKPLFTLHKQGEPGKPSGVLRVDVDLAKTLGDLFDHPVGKEGYAYLVDSSGTILAHRDAAMAGTDVSDLYSTRRAFEGFRGVHYSDDETGVHPMRKAFRPIQASDLAVVVAIPSAEVFEPIAQLRSRAIPAALAVFVALALFGLSLVRRVIAPIRRLTRATAQVAAGDLDVVSEVQTKDEIQELSNAFNEMTAHLKESRRDLARKTRALISAARALQESEQNLRTTLDSIGEAVVATDRQGKVTRMNRAAESLVSVSAQQAHGQPLTDVFRLVESDSRVPVPDPVERIIRAGHNIGFTNHTLLLAADGAERHIADSGAPIRDANGEIVGAVLVFRDMTERYQMEGQLRQSQKMESIGQLAGGIAHDFNNLLMAINGSAELLGIELQENGAPTSTSAMVDMIRTAAKRAAELTTHLLQFSRRRPLEFALVDLHEIAGEVVDMASRTFDKRIEILTALRATTTVVLGERAALQNAILNLAINARDAMPEGGVLTLSSREETLDSDDCRRLGGELRPGAYIELTVGDTGTGIDAATRERIFEPFFTTKEVGRGTGLGLSMVYATVMGHRGAISIDTEPGAGTRMHILLPLAGDDTRPDAGKPDIVKGQGRLLLVDDERVARKTTEAMLRHLGYDVLAVENGARALEAFTADPVGFDLVVLDMIMPGENGCEVLKKLLAVRPDTRVLMVSGHVGDGPRAEAMELGARGLLHKPFTMTQLSHEVAALVQDPAEPT